MPMKKSLILFSVLAMCLAESACAQKMGRYHKNLMYEAELYFLQGDYYYAAELYEELMRVAPDHPTVAGNLGISYYHLPPLKEKALPNLERAAEAGHTEALFYLAKLRHEDYRFIDALELLAAYERKPDRETPALELAHTKAASNRAADFVMNPVPVRIENLGERVNSEVHDYAPVWDMIRHRLFFTSRRKFDDKSEKDYSEQFDENIYEVDLTQKPLTARPALGSVNSRSNDAAVACTPEGEQLLIYRTSKDGFSGNFFEANRVGQGWGELEPLSSKINSKYQEASACFGPYGEEVMYFSSDRPGGYGGKDLYKVQKLPDGNWGEPMNLGPEINTEYDEDAPFVSNDGTLYFASKGHNNMGGYDIFSALPTANGFSSPTNMGYPINTPADDIFFSIDNEGLKGYFSSDRRGGFGLQDLYSIHFDQKAMVMYRGQLFDNQFPAGTRASIRVVKEEKETFVYQLDGSEHDFTLALESGKNYTVSVEVEGYQALTRTLNFDAADESGEVIETYQLSK